MVEFESKVDSNQKIYIPNPLKALFYPAVVIKPDKFAGVVYRKGTPLKHVRASLEVIIQDIDNEIKIKEETKREEEEMADAFYSGLAFIAVTIDEGESIPVESLFRRKKIFPLSEAEIRHMLNFLAQQGRVVFTDNGSKIKVVLPEE